jgi:hypothetical protein
MIHIDPKNFSKEQLRVLPMTLWVLLRTCIPPSDVEITIRPELNTSAGMVLRYTFNFYDAAGGFA